MSYYDPTQTPLWRDKVRTPCTALKYDTSTCSDMVFAPYPDKAKQLPLNSDTSELILQDDGKYNPLQRVNNKFNI